MAGAVVAALIVGRVVAPGPMVTPPPAPTGEVALGVPRWLVDVGARQPLLDLVAHPPVVAGRRVLVAGSQIGYVALDRDRGAIAWRRPGGQTLAAPLVLSPHDVVLIRECDQPLATPADRALLACFDRIDPIAIAGRASGSIVAPLADANGCLGGTAAWQVVADGDRFTAWRGACGVDFTLPDGVAVRSGLPPIAPSYASRWDGCEAVNDMPWCQRVADGTSEVELEVGRLPGLSVLAAARDGRRAAVVVRADATLQHDVLYALVDGEAVWRWPLPAPAQGRVAPVAVSIGQGGVFVLFDSERVAAFAAP